MNFSGKRCQIVCLCGAILAALASLAVLSLPGVRPRDLLLRHWRGQLASAPRDQVRLRAEQIAALDEDGLPLLVEALFSDREVVATAAGEVLNEKLDRWQMLRSKESSAKVARLAQLLVMHSAKRAATGRRCSTDLATRILLWPVDRQVIDGAQLVADCETVLRSAANPSSKDAAPPSDPAPGVVQDLAPPAVSADVPQKEAGVHESTALFPVGGLPSEIVDVPQLPRATLGAPEAQPIEQRRPGPCAPGLFVPPPAAVTTAVSSSRPLTTSDAAAREDTPPGQPGAATTNRSGTLPDIAVMRGLVSTDPSVSTATIQELRRHGFQPIHLELAKRLVDPDPAVRLDLVDALPQIGGVDARPWLIWLSRDEDASVRKAAVTVIATSNDPALRRQLHQRELEESDPDVLRLVRSVLRGNRTEVRRRK